MNVTRSASNGEGGRLLSCCRDCSKYFKCGCALKCVFNVCFFIKEHGMTYCRLSQALLFYKYVELPYKMHFMVTLVQFLAMVSAAPGNKIS